MNTPVKESSIAIANRPATRNMAARDNRETVSRRMVLLDAHGIVVAVDNDWMSLSTEIGTPTHRLEPGMNFLELCRQASKSSAAWRKALFGVRGVLKGDIPSFALDYTSQLATRLAVFRVRAIPITFENARVAITHTEITDLHQSKDKDFRRVQQLARKLMAAREQERQKLSRHMHDDLGNRIALIAFSVRQAMKQRGFKAFKSREELLNKVLDDINELSTSLRDISSYLYPPTLRYAGIRAALKSLVSDCERESQIKIDVALPLESPRLPEDVQLCIFRICQECLDNVVKHSGAHKARVAFESTHGHVRLTVSDLGHGFTKSEAAENDGLGLVSMEERALSFGGELTVSSSSGLGTEICLTIPIQKSWKEASSE